MGCWLDGHLNWEEEVGTHWNLRNERGKRWASRKEGSVSGMGEGGFQQGQGGRKEPRMRMHVWVLTVSVDGAPHDPKPLVHWADETHRDENASEIDARQDMARSQRNVLRVIYDLEGVWKRMNVLRNDGQENGFKTRLVQLVGQMMKSVNPGLQLEKAIAPHSSTLAWKIPWMGEPGGLQSMGLLRIGHDWATSLSLFTFMDWRKKWQPTPVFLPGESQGQRSLVGCHQWGRTESDMTEVT